MLSDSYTKMNEYDKIIFKNGIFEDKCKTRFLIVEDLKNKKWVVYNGVTGMYRELDFGAYVTFTINEFINYSPDAMHHASLFNDIQSGCITKEDATRIYNSGKKAMKNLLGTFAELPDWKKWADPEQLKKIMLQQWKFFRYASYGKMWSGYAETATETLDDLIKSFAVKYPKIEKEEIEEIYESNKEAAQEFFETMHEVVKKNFVIYYDEITFIDKDNKDRIGRAFLVDDEIRMFAWDLYHILVSGVTETPHICPRCENLYYSNNNKSKYCDSCKSNYSDIRKEYRKKNQARYIHKRINDKLHSKRYSEEVLDKFMVESNYYWDIVKQKEPKTKPESWYLDINTEEEYKRWLESKLKEYSARK